jgi:hypothetical protein
MTEWIAIARELTASLIFREPAALLDSSMVEASLKRATLCRRMNTMPAEG